jgi:hypothetical protein
VWQAGVALAPQILTHQQTYYEKSTLKIRVKWRLRIWCHRPSVSFGCEASVVGLTGQRDEANA